MDLSTLSVDPDNQTAELEIVHPSTFEPISDDDGNVLTLTLYGPDSNALKAVQDEFQAKAFKDGVKRRKMSINPKQIKAQAMAYTVAAVADWKHISFEGKELECTPKNVRMVFEKLPWLKEQVDEFISERSNFLGK